jgi:hypothetical protein
LWSLKTHFCRSPSKEATPMVKGLTPCDKLERFVPTPWSRQSQEWQAIEERLDPEHLARRVDQAVDLLDLGPLFDSYRGVGKKALRPDLLVKLVLYEMHNNRPSPAQWARDVVESEPVRWLLLGLKPSRARLYDFRDRIARFWPVWNAAVVRLAVAAKLTPALRASLDSSSVAAAASRRQLLNDERLAKRRMVIAEALACHARGQTVVKPPGWLAKSVVGLREQKRRYGRAAEVLRARQAANVRRRSSKRKPADKVLVSVADPEAVLARDKFNVFRPLYSVELLRDLDSPLVLGYDVMTQINENGVVRSMIDQMVEPVGHKPEVLLVDSGYVSLQHLEECASLGITMYGPPQENEYSASNGKKPQCNQKTELPKGAFEWLSEEQTYRCPEGRIALRIYLCPAEHCLACPRQRQCTRSPERGRSVSRLENEELLDKLRARMATDEAKRLYKLRSRTVELNFADLKEHRGLRRFHGRGLRHAKGEVAALVLAHNMLFVQSRSRTARLARALTEESVSLQIAQAA